MGNLPINLQFEDDYYEAVLCELYERTGEDTTKEMDAYIRDGFDNAASVPALVEEIITTWELKTRE